MSEGLKKVYGIDLGTTYSAIAYVDEHGKPVIVPNQESERITPSVVLFDGENIIVGDTAKESAKVEPHRVVSRIKQHMGDPHFVFEHDGQVYSPEDISSFILRKVVGDAELTLGLEGDDKITDVVITCPAYFGTDEREATANAGRLAGLNVREFLNEPTAAAIAYGLEQGEDQTVLVYDLGGGTFDITMIEIKDRLIRVICTGGDHRLGGAFGMNKWLFSSHRTLRAKPLSKPIRWTIPRCSTTCSCKPSEAKRRSHSARRLHFA